MKAISIKIPNQLDERIKLARRTARSQGSVLNVSGIVTEYLEREIKKVEKVLGYEYKPKLQNDNQEFKFDS